MIESKINNSNQNNNSFDDEIFIAYFRKQAHEYLENDLVGGLSNIDEKNIPTFSETGDEKIKKMIKQAIRKENSRRRIKRLPRVAMIILIVLAVCSVTVMSVEALRVPFLNLFVNTEEKVTNIELDERKTDDQSNNMSDLFGYIPDEYELESEDIQEQVATFVYTNENKDSISIYRFLGEGSVSVDTEKAEYGEMIINSNKCFYSVKNGETNLVYVKDGYAYLISGSINLEEIIKIAEKIK